jgi:hypothetical protein
MKFREKKAFLSKTVNRLPERSPIPDSGYSNKIARQAQGGIRRYRAFSMHDLVGG